MTQENHTTMEQKDYQTQQRAQKLRDEREKFRQNNKKHQSRALKKQLLKDIYAELSSMLSPQDYIEDYASLETRRRSLIVMDYLTPIFLGKFRRKSRLYYHYSLQDISKMKVKAYMEQRKIYDASNLDREFLQRFYEIQEQ